MIKGYEKAAAEYEAKMSDPYGEVLENDWDAKEEYFTDQYEEEMLERQIDGYLWGY